MKDLVLQPMGFGQILDGAFTLYRRHVAAMVGVVAVLYGPVMVVSVVWFGSFATYTPEQVDLTEMLALSGGLGVLNLAILLAYTVTQGALTQAVSDAFLSRPVSIGGACRAALRRLLPLVAGGILKLLLTLLFSMLGLVLIIPIAVGLAFAGLAESVLGIAGGIVGVLGVLILMCVAWAVFFAVAPLIMLENAGPVQAIARSLRLSRGNRIRILLVIATAFLIPLALAFGGSIAVGFLVPNAILAQALGQVITLAFMPYYATCVVLLYYDTRVRSEGFDLLIQAEQLRPVGGTR